MKASPVVLALLRAQYELRVDYTHIICADLAGPDKVVDRTAVLAV